MKTGRIAALDIGGTKMKGGLFINGQLINQTEIDTLASLGAPDVMRRAGDLLDLLYPFDKIGISTAGQVDVETGGIRYANENMPGYTGTQVGEYFSRRFRVPVAVLNDVYAAGYGEGILGAAKGYSDYLCITYGTGIGGSVFLGGQPYYGAGASAGIMLGGLITHPEARKHGDVFSGTYERCAATTALVTAAKAVDPVLTNGREIFMRIADPTIRAVVERWLDEIALGLCSLIHVFNPPLIVLGGGIMEQNTLIEGISARTETQIIPGFRGAKITGALLGNTAGLYGAAYYVDNFTTKGAGSL